MSLIRWLHKWFGLVLGLQFLLWALSGAVMASLDHRKIEADQLVLLVARPAGGVAPVSLAAVGRNVEGPILGLTLKPLFDRYVYEVETPTGVRLLDADSGAAIVIDAAQAKALAVARYAGSASVQSVRRLDGPTLETRGLDIPVWRVAFADKAHTAFLISAETGELEGARTDTWRIWDVAWMLHIMDYKARESFNHPLIVTVATGAAWLVLSGLILLFRSFRRSDVAWLVGPFVRRRQAASKETR